MIKVKKDGVDLDQAQDRIQELLVLLSKDSGNTEAERELVKLYEDVSSFSPNCPACIAGRALFMKSLADAKNGELLEATAKIRASMKSVSFKWGRFLKGLGLD